ncbi:MAG TPA: aldose 1-epimerase [Candidatus Dormibacteraeota bacterium]|nr:aldose 1-epimerase [Candidatus Dormibacteraeota bacterium]
MAYAVGDREAAGHVAVTLSDRGADLQAAFVPALGMIGCSLRHRGDELLGQRGGLAKYAASGSTMGIPLLHPWANRLAGYAYRVGGHEVAIAAANPRLHRDGNGLPMHGLLAACPHWRVSERHADDGGARLVATLDFAADPVLLAAFPFPHTLTLAITLHDAALRIATTLRATGDVAVPVAFGFHPYLTLPGVERRAWQLHAPVRRRARLDARGLPTGDSEPVRIADGPLGERTFDDLFPELDTPARFVLAGGGRRLTVTFDEGYPCAQIFAPPGEAVVCFEPMTAPTNALASGIGLRTVAPGADFACGFAIAVA